MARYQAVVGVYQSRLGIEYRDQVIAAQQIGQGFSQADMPATRMGCQDQGFRFFTHVRIPPALEDGEGMALNYRIEGRLDGPVLLLVHGLGVTFLIWQHLAPLLQP